MANEQMYVDELEFTTDVNEKNEDDVIEEVIQNTNDTEKDSDNIEYGSVIENYKVLQDMISQMDEEIKTFESLLKSDCEEYKVKFESIVQDVNTFLSNESFDIGKFTLESVSEEMLKEIKSNILEEDSTISDEDIFTLYNRVFDLVDMKKEAINMKAESNKLITEYSHYLSSEEYENAKKERLKKLEESLINEPDGPKKREIKKMVDVMKSTMNLSFIFKNIDMFGDKAIDSIVSAFFDKNRSAYTIEKYRTKISKLGYNPDIYKYFFNIEEKYLEEKYHVYNNLFLFYVMRYIAYATVDVSSEKMYCQTLISNLGNLIYYKFPSENDKEFFLSCVRKLLDKFERYYDKFDKDNFLHPNHPYRKEKDIEHDKELREMIFTNLKNNKIEVTDEILNMNTDDLKKYYKETLDRIEEEVKKSKAGAYASKIAETYVKDPDNEVVDGDVESEQVLAPLA